VEQIVRALSDEKIAEKETRRFRQLWEEARSAVETMRKPTTDSSGFEPISIERLVATHYMKGKNTVDSTTERWITATVDGIDRYRVRTWAAAGTDIKILPLLNCTAGSTESVDMGGGLEGRITEMLLPEKLMAGQMAFFASRVLYSKGTEWDFAEVQVTSLEIRELVLRIQFDTTIPLPKACWSYADRPDVDSHIRPPQDSDRYLLITSCGYVDHTFLGCRSGAKYGIHWIWT
jgi:hypothetical protein